MVMCALGDIFQARVDELLGEIKGVKTYINYILVLNKGCFGNYIEQLRMMFGILRAAGLKFNAPKCSFGLKAIPYLFCVITRESIKPDTKKVQEVMDLGRPATTTEAQALIGMVQYYSDMCHVVLHISSSERGG